MHRVLFPGRHHLLTNFQMEYLTRVTSGEPATLQDVQGRPLESETRIDTIIWAVTSANHSNTRRNPVPGHRREVAIEEFAQQLDAESYVFLIDDIGSSPRFADYVIKKIEVDSHGRLRLTPADTLVACSTPEVIALYEALGFRVIPVELANLAAGTYCEDTPWHLMDRIVQAGLRGDDWRKNDDFVTKVARATRRLFHKYGYGDAMIELHRSSLLTADGDLTETRDYNTYARSFDQGAARKYQLVRDHLLPGRIVDVGCCTGAVLREISHDPQYRESDLYGIEVARPLYMECLHRKEQGGFGNDHVFFRQQDFAAGPVFPDNSVNTFLTFALTHEVESYAGRAALEHFMELLYGQLALNGRWINVDVVGPDQPDELVYLWLREDDGEPADDPDRVSAAEERKELRDYLEGLSTRARFERFVRDFRHEEGYRLVCRWETIDDRRYAVLRLGDACEFLSKKDYTDNWLSEMHETFCFWSFHDWTAAVERVGFRVLPASHAYTNPWLVEHRYRGKAELFTRQGAALVPLEYPVTNLLLVAEKV